MDIMSNELMSQLFFRFFFQEAVYVYSNNGIQNIVNSQYSGPSILRPPNQPDMWS